uniref:Target of myb1 like 2 membrane trafficking protein n=1 Tax=Sus scrofa TaxID=9823 RepID=A0A8D1GIY3_PIG
RWPPGRDGGDEPRARLVSAAEWPAGQAAAAASSLQAPVRWLTPHIWGHQGRLAAWAPLRHQLVPQSPTGCLTWGQGLRSARGPRLPGTRRVWRRPGRGGGWRWGPAAPGPGDLSACPRQVLETCVKNCGHRFHVLVANRDFVDSVLVKVISPKNSPPAIVQDKVLALIQAWADAFRSSPDLTGVVHTYEELKRKGVEFPTADLDALSPIHTPQRSVPEVDPAATVPRPQAQPKTSSSPYSAPPASYSAPQAPALSATGPITANSEQIARLRSELAVVRGNTKVLSEMLTEMVPGQEAASDLELLQELHRTCRAMQQRVVELVSRVSNEEVTEELLRVNDDLNNVFLRYERFERYRSGRSVQNASNGVLSDVTEDNLIDLGPGSPAVVSPTVGGVAPPSSLSSQLAGLGPPWRTPRPREYFRLPWTVRSPAPKWWWFRDLNGADLETKTAKREAKDTVKEGRPVATAPQCNHVGRLSLTCIHLLKRQYLRAAVVAQRLANPTSVHEDSGLVPGLAQWVKDLVLPRAVV